jgi:uncharacterized membrane protein YeaQ/YmgE (transglycosylase-associated protein family)
MRASERAAAIPEQKARHSRCSGNRNQSSATAMHVLWILLVGFVAGIIARRLLPGPNNPSGFILTTVLGIAGAFVATYLGQSLGWYRVEEGAGFIGATLGAVIVLFVWHRLVVTHKVTDPTTRDPLGPRRWL